MELPHGLSCDKIYDVLRAHKEALTKRSGEGFSKKQRRRGIYNSCYDLLADLDNPHGSAERIIEACPKVKELLEEIGSD